MGTIRGKYWNIAMQGIIKYMIKYLLDYDGLFSFFLNSIILNNRLIKICRELEALGFDSYLFSNFNLSRVDYEENSVLVEDKIRGKMRKKEMGNNKEDLCRDLRREMILGSMKESIYSRPGRSVCKIAATYDSPSNEKIDRTVSIQSKKWTGKNPQDIFESNYEDSCQLKNSSNLLNEIISGKSEDASDLCCDSKDVSLKLRTFKESNCKWNRRRRRRRRRRVVSLKPRIRSRSRRLSLPFKANPMMGEIFKVDPIFHYSYLIGIKRKFETRNLNLCFCLNDVDRQIFNASSTIVELRLIFDIRRDYINFKLIGRKRYQTRSDLFFTNRFRVPISLRKHKLNDKVILFKTNGSQNKKGKNDILIEEKKTNFPEQYGESKIQSLVENIDQISDNLSSRCSKAGKQFDVDSTFILWSSEDISFDRITESSSLSSNKTLIVQSPRINKDACILKEKNSSLPNIFQSKDEILNLTKNERKEQTKEKIIEDVCCENNCDLKTGKIDHVVGIGENEEIVNSCSSRINIDSLTSRKILSKEEVNFDCDSRCSCSSKKEQNDGSSVILMNEEKVETNSKLESELHKAHNSSMIEFTLMGGVPMYDISKKNDQVLSSTSRKNSSMVLLSIEMSKMRMSSKFLHHSDPNPSIIVPTINVRVQRLRLKEEGLIGEKFPNKESLRKMKIGIFSKEESKDLFLSIDCEKRFLMREYKNSRPSVGTWTCSYNRKGEELSKDETWTRRIKNDVGLTGTKSTSKSFYESFYNGKKIIGKLKNVVRGNLWKFMRRDKTTNETIDKRLEKRKKCFYQKKGNAEEKGRRENPKASTNRHSDKYYFIYEDLRSSEDDRRLTKFRNNYVPINARESIKRSKSRSSNRDLFDKTKYFIEIKKNDKKNGRRKSKGANDRVTIRNEKSDKEKKMNVVSSTIMRNDEKSINDLGLDFRSKLEEYVDLCKNVKCSLIGNGERRRVDVGRLS